MARLTTYDHYNLIDSQSLDDDDIQMTRAASGDNETINLQIDNGYGRMLVLELTPNDLRAHFAPLFQVALTGFDGEPTS